MIRSDLCDAIRDKVGLSRDDSENLVERILDLISEALEHGEPVLLTGFGRFEARAKAARMGRNPITGADALITPRRTISFSASSVLKARVRSGLVAKI